MMIEEIDPIGSKLTPLLAEPASQQAVVSIQAVMQPSSMDRSGWLS